MTMTKLLLEKNIRVPFWPQVPGTSILPSSQWVLLLHSLDNRKQEYVLEKLVRIILTDLSTQSRTRLIDPGRVIIAAKG